MYAYVCPVLGILYVLFGSGISSSPIILAEVEGVADITIRENDSMEMEAGNSSQVDRRDGDWGRLCSYEVCLVLKKKFRT